uniref:Radial spoke head protein 9 homolog n=2 Tax=Macrostomum lignano TaxID=282301 RepID=A0A1I8GUU3_9PLAT
MESTTFKSGLEYLGGSGVVLSPEQRAKLQTSLVILKQEQKFQKVYLWGRISGIKDDYFIAKGVGQDELSDTRALYSKDCMEWGVLPVATPEIKAKAALARGRFTGDPSHDFEHVEVKRIPGEGDEIHEEEETITIKEEERLAAVVAEIDSDVAIVPRGAFVRTPNGQVVENRSFEGLSVADSCKLTSYLHFRGSGELHRRRQLEFAGADKAIDFLDPIAEDIPLGSWGVVYERGSGLVCLRSHLWPGYYFYHVPGTRLYGSFYAGVGQKNLDLAFML